MAQSLETLQSIAIPLATFIMLVVIFLFSTSLSEYVASLILALALGFYYTEAIQTVIAKISFLSKVPVSEWLQSYHNLIITYFSKFDGFTVFGKTFFAINVNNRYVATRLPVILLFLGVVVRLVIERYVKHERLKQAGREYWLFITTYLVLAAIVSTLIQWSLLKILIASLVIVFIVAAGIFRVGTDFLSGLWALLLLVGRAMKIVAMYIALAGTKIAKALRNLVKFIRNVYEAYIIEPFRRLYRGVQSVLDRAERRVQIWLDNERLDD